MKIKSVFAIILSLLLLLSGCKSTAPAEISLESKVVYPAPTAQDFSPVLADSGNYGTFAINDRSRIVNLGDSAVNLTSGQFDFAKSVAVGGWHCAVLWEDGTIYANGSNKFGQCETSDWQGIVSVAAGTYHTVGVTTLGTVIATGQNSFNQCATEKITNAKAVAAGERHTVILKDDGTVEAVGQNTYGQCNTEEWKNIIQISAGPYHTVGLTEDGKVLCTGLNSDSQCETNDWAQVKQIDASNRITVGVTTENKLLVTGNSSAAKTAPALENVAYAVAGNNTYYAFNQYGAFFSYDYVEGDPENWTDAVSISSSYGHAVILRSDGTVYAAGDNSRGQCNVSHWENIIQICAGASFTAGLKEDGTVLIATNTESNLRDAEKWTDIVSITVGRSHIAGLKEDGTVVAAGGNSNGECNTQSWKDIVKIDATDANVTVGLRNNGRVVIAGDSLSDDHTEAMKTWINIEDIYCDGNYIYGYKDDGTFVYSGKHFVNDVAKYGERQYTQNGDVFILFNEKYFSDPHNADYSLCHNIPMPAEPVYYCEIRDGNFIKFADGSVSYIGSTYSDPKKIPDLTLYGFTTEDSLNEKESA